MITTLLGDLSGTCVRFTSGGNWYACAGEGIPLASFNNGHVNAAESLIEEVVEIKLRAKMQEHTAKSDCRSIHKDELARDGHRTLFAKGLMDLKRLFTSIHAGINIKE